MKYAFRCACVLLSFAGAADAQVIECTPELRRALVPSAREVDEHRQAPLPTIAYPYGARRSSWQFDLVLRVDATGRVECHGEAAAVPGHNPDRGIDGPRRAMIDSLRDWRYQPFVRDGKPVPVLITERLREYEKPERRRAVPEVPLDQVRISLARSMCNGSCPDYRVELSGDGRATYMGNRYTVVRGLHRYSVDSAEVAALVERLRSSDVWSSRARYRAQISDSPTYTVRIQLGKVVHTIEDYEGDRVGMPPDVAAFEDAVDAAAGSRDFIHLSLRALEVLRREGFRFDSQEGARLLSRAVNDPDSDDAALARLVEMGAPLNLPRDQTEFSPMGPPGPPLHKALEYRHPRAVEALLARGALDLEDRHRQDNLDAAFRAAIKGGDIALVTRIWNLAGDRLRPSLSFEDATDGSADPDAQVRKNADVITLVARGWGAQTGDFQEIVEFLVSKGSDLRATRASGETLLHAAANAQDTKFVRYLLSKGLDPTVSDNHGITPLGSTLGEEVAMLLLEAGADSRSMSSRHFSFRRFVEYHGWYRVLAWLDAHGE